MIKYFIYGESDKKPIRKTKHENDAMLFATDFKNLNQYGCMMIVREDDDGVREIWDPDIKAWTSEGENG